MLRLIPIAVCLAAIACGLVQLRRQESVVRCEIQRLSIRQTQWRRELWDQQVRSAQATAPEQVRRHVQNAYPEWSQAPQPLALARPVHRR